jgi:enterochelin esterase-like enzyme
VQPPPAAQFDIEEYGLTKDILVKKLSIFFATAAMVYSQQQAQVPRPVSPEVASDGRVTFRYYDPHAQKVTVDLEGAKGPAEMQKDAQGIWSLTTAPMTPDIYGYTFSSDGSRRLDPFNPDIKPNLLGVSNAVHVPGASPLPWEDSDIPHGTVHHHFYKSGIVGDNRDFFVYTPPGYDPAASTKYPVLYLLHGYSDDASGWTAVGKANLILDNLIAEKKAKPMIVVMTLGYGAPDIVKPHGPGFSNVKLREENFTKFTGSLIEEVIPTVERTYKADTNRDARAITGLSMGGAESLLTGLNHTDLFSWVGGFSSGGLGEDYAAAFPKLSDAANSQLHLLWISCGTEDRLITPNRKFIEWLKGKNIKVTPIETPGMHTWMVWRRNLIAFAPLLFQGSSATTTAP